MLDPTTRARLLSLRRWLFVLAAATATWAISLIVTGGFVLSVGSLRLSSHNPVTPLLIGIAGLSCALVVSRLLDEPLRWRDAWPRARSTVPSATLIAFVIAAAVLDVHQLFGAAPLWLDEEMIALNIRDRSFAELGGLLWLGQSAPYGWLIVQRGVLLTLGSSEIALRLLPTLFGIATYVVALWIARRWLGWLGGLALVLQCVFGHWLSHYRVEVKHYSGDALAALLLPALAVWASEGTTSTARERRTIAWWVVAVGALWLANGAIFVAPACVVFALTAIYRRDGLRAALKQATWGLVWLVSFALHYQISLRHTGHLRDLWAAEFPPTDAGWLQTAWWLLARLDGLAAHVAGSNAGAIFWALAVAGFAWSARPALAAVYAGVTLSGFALASLRVVPMFDRFALWLIPALYVGIALLIDRSVRHASDAFRRRGWVRGAAGVAIAGAACLVCAGIVQRGAGRFHLDRPTSKQGVDDRTAITWLIGQRQPGDALITTPEGLPALWWYGRISIAGDVASRGPDGSATYEVIHRPKGSGCSLPTLLKDHRRALVYVGFPDMPSGFDGLLFDELGRIGTLTAYREEAELSRAAVVDLHAGAARAQAFSGRERRPPIEGCVAGRPAVRR